ncbi:MAG TPA: YukJ family protein [Ktedonobacteraceae bacterium]
MPVQNYGVLKAHPVNALKGSSNPHYQIHVVDANQVDYRIAVNVQSQDNPPALLYYALANFQYPTQAQQTQLAELSTGYTALPKQAGGLAIDFQRGGFFDPSQISQLFTVEAENQLQDLLDPQIQQAIADPAAFVCAFGSHWYEPGKPDQIFGFSPGNGQHNIHMNQGNETNFASEDGIWQDGALLIYQPSTNLWSAIFLLFQSQQLPTDDYGHRQ